MDDAARVRVAEAVAHAERDLELAGEAHRFAGAHPLLEVAPLEELHREKRRVAFFAEVVDVDDVAVGEVGRGACLAEEALAVLGAATELRGDDLDRHRPCEQGIERLVHGAHPTLAETLGDLVTTNTPHVCSCVRGEYSVGRR